MDPVSAVGIAAAAVQFLEASIKAYNTFQEIRHSSERATAGNQQLEDDIRSAQTLRTSLVSTRAPQGARDPVSKLTERCTSKADELLTLLEYVHGSGEDISSVRAATRSFRKRRAIEELHLSLKESQDTLNHMISQELLPAIDLLKVQQSVEFANISSIGQKLIKEQIEQRKVQEVHNATVTHKLDHIQQDMQLHVDEADRQKRREKFLESLWFPQIDQRRNEIKPPAPTTLEWFFGVESTTDSESDRSSGSEGASDEDSTLYNSQWDGYRGGNINQPRWPNFRQWLREDASTYWISGKAGSGKSTLMAHIVDDERTREDLEIWSSGQRLEILSFFFWRAGSELENSVLGLLRSLLYQLCLLEPKIVDSFLGKLSSPMTMIPTWTERSLLSFVSEAIQSCGHLRLCIFIDGLDEFTGPYDGLVDDIDKLSSYSNVKRIPQKDASEQTVSSRPETRIAARSAGLLEVVDFNGGFNKTTWEYATAKYVSNYPNFMLLSKTRDRRRCSHDEPLPTAMLRFERRSMSWIHRSAFDFVFSPNSSPLIDFEWDLEGLMHRIGEAWIKYTTYAPTFIEDYKQRSALSSRLEAIITFTSGWYDDYPKVAIALLNTLHSVCKEIEDKHELLSDEALNYHQLSAQTTTIGGFYFWNMCVNWSLFPYILCSLDSKLKHEADVFLATYLLVVPLTYYLGIGAEGEKASTINQFTNSMVNILLQTIRQRLEVGDTTEATQYNCIAEEHFQHHPRRVTSFTWKGPVTHEWVATMRILVYILSKRYVAESPVNPFNLPIPASLSTMLDVTALYVCTKALELKKIHIQLSATAGIKLAESLAERGCDGDALRVHLSAYENLYSQDDTLHALFSLGEANVTKVSDYIRIQPSAATSDQLLSLLLYDCKTMKGYSEVYFDVWSDKQKLQEVTQMLLEDIKSAGQDLDGGQQLLAAACVKAGFLDPDIVQRDKLRWLPSYKAHFDISQVGSRTSKMVTMSVVRMRQVLGLVGVALLSVSPTNASPLERRQTIEIQSTGNPILADGSYFSADPAPIVVDGTVYVISGRDQAGATENNFVINQWQIFESADPDPSGGEWTLHANVAQPQTIFSWARSGTAYAAQIVQGSDGKFYLYAPVTQSQTSSADPFAIGVAVSDSVLGPYSDAHPSGPIISQSVPSPGNNIQNIDPTVLVDDDGSVYIYFGTFGQLLAYELDTDMVTIKSTSVTRVTSLTGFFEAPWLMKRGSTYYMLYAGNNAGSNSPCTPTSYHACIAYGTASSPLGPWTYRGVVLDIVSSTTSHPGVFTVDGGDTYYLTYHTRDATGGTHFRRSMAIDELEFDDSTSPPTIKEVTQTHRPTDAAEPTRNIAPQAKAASATRRRSNTGSKRFTTGASKRIHCRQTTGALMQRSSRRRATR
ncbi:hypothetical protein NPX13_g1486 [Xylaria arbuscula]|uniref:NACHT domain-containing protein n=1 Tax=Xylaria arbuscula TaxID=114810 RepID=A0A9W8NLZ0_9PEZI|nr:hypothetical protein NPX13_g1486 [Xylaria arbuscula]